MSTSDEASAKPITQHRAAVSNSLGWAQEAADRGDYFRALGWIGVLESIGEQIPAGYQAKRLDWQKQLIARRADRPNPDAQGKRSSPRTWAR